MFWFLVILFASVGFVLWEIHNAAEFNPAWEEDKMLTQEELEELANDLWESDDGQ